MSSQVFFDRLKEHFGDWILAANPGAGDPWIEVAPEHIVDVMGYLRDAPDMAFDFLNCISGVDYFHADEKKAQKSAWDPHLEVVYHISSLRSKRRLVIKIKLPRWKGGAEGELPEVPSVAGIWKTANWHEREVYDLLGVRFTGHPDLRRILCPEDWTGHPLRKDYIFPNEYHGIRSEAGNPAAR